MTESTRNKRQRAFSRRSRTGCFTCRRRRVKCDEARPICKNCERGSRKCTFPTTPDMTSIQTEIQRSPHSIPVKIAHPQQLIPPLQNLTGQTYIYPTPTPTQPTNQYFNNYTTYPPIPHAPPPHHVYNYPVAHVPSIYEQQQVQQQQQHQLQYYHQLHHQQQQQQQMAIKYELYHKQPMAGYNNNTSHIYTQTVPTPLPIPFPGRHISPLIPLPLHALKTEQSKSEHIGTPTESPHSSLTSSSHQPPIQHQKIPIHNGEAENSKDSPNSN